MTVQELIDALARFAPEQRALPVKKWREGDTGSDLEGCNVYEDIESIAASTDDDGDPVVCLF